MAGIAIRAGDPLGTVCLMHARRNVRPCGTNPDVARSLRTAITVSCPAVLQNKLTRAQYLDEVTC